MENSDTAVWSKDDWLDNTAARQLTTILTRPGQIGVWELIALGEWPEGIQITKVPPRLAWSRGGTYRWSTLKFEFRGGT